MRPRPMMTWRAFDHRQRRVIERQLGSGEAAACPGCGELLEAEPTTRLAAVLPAGVSGFDLVCRGCRKFLARIRHTPASRRELRLRRFVAAVRRA